MPAGATTLARAVRRRAAGGLGGGPAASAGADAGKEPCASESPAGVTSRFQLASERQHDSDAIRDSDGACHWNKWPVILKAWKHALGFPI